MKIIIADFPTFKRLEELKVGATFRENGGESLYVKLGNEYPQSKVYAFEDKQITSCGAKVLVTECSIEEVKIRLL